MNSNSIYRRKNTGVSITAFYALTLPEFHMRPHTHASCEIMYVTGGSCTVFCDGDEIALSANQFIFIDAGLIHRLEIASGKPCSILNLEFCCQEKKRAISTDALFDQSPDFQAFLRKEMPYFVSPDLRSLGYALKDVISQLKRQESRKEEDYLIHLLFLRMLLELSFCANQNRKTTGMYYLKKACGYIEGHLCETIRIPELAAYTGIHKSYLQSLFSRILSCTITEYINRKRLEQAAFLLTNSSMRVIDIAFSTGYNSRQHFAHTFEKYYGTSPQKYRLLHSRTLAADTGREQHLIREGGTQLCRLTEL